MASDSTPDSPTEEDIARSVSEDRRLVELGIDPDGDPIARMKRLKWIKEEVKRRMEAGTLETLGFPRYPEPEKIDSPPQE